MSTGLINIGNTHTSICGTEFYDLRTIKTEKLLQSNPLKNQYERFIIASVVPEAAKKLKNQLKNKEVHFISADQVDWIDFSKVDSKTLGADRVANIVGAHEKYENVVVIDCGTCITTELINNNEFLGGLIMPGRSLQRKAINLHTGLLPEISLKDKLPKIGRNTEEALRVGMDTIPTQGLLAWIENVIFNYFEMRACFTGGDAPFFMQHANFDFEEFRNLTLYGLKVFAEKKGLL